MPGEKTKKNKPLKETVLREYPSIGKYRIRVLQNTQKQSPKVVDIREFVSTEKFEGFTRRGVRIGSKEELGYLVATLADLRDHWESLT